MLRFRLFLIWLAVAAIPLQGLAAASMLFCAMGAPQAAGQVAAAQHEHQVGFSSASGLHDHAKHSHSGEVQAKKAADTGGKQLPGADHKCGACSSCCHSVAIVEFPLRVAIAPVPQAESAEPFVLIAPRPSTVPDKPPRV